MRQLRITQSMTARSRTLNRYMAEIKRCPMVTPEEETDLAFRIRRGDDAALARLVEANLRFVVSVAKNYQGRGLDLEDLIDDGNIGLMRAAAGFDPTRGFRFISYAVWWIRQSILQGLSDHARTVRLPMNRVADRQELRHRGGD